jgi:RNA polymerase sigma-70 factor (ECF subfamily)
LNLNGFDGNLKFSSWIYRIVHNQVISQYRKIKARPEGHAVDIEDQAAKNLASEMNIAAGVDSNILKEKFSRLLDLLPEKYREALVLRFWEEKSYQEISDILRKPAGTIASTISKAKRELRRLALKNDIKL